MRGSLWLLFRKYRSCSCNTLAQPFPFDLKSNNFVYTIQLKHKSDWYQGKMGRNKSKTQKYHNHRRKRRRINRENDGKPQERIVYSTCVVENNQLFNSYYKAQGFASETPDDFEKMLEMFRGDLPSTIRVHAKGPFYKKISEYLEGLEKEYPKTLSTGEVLTSAPSRIPWYPNGVAWKLGTDRVTLRKEESLKDLHRFIVREAKTENITRQEEVSMIPPLLLGIEPHHKILDCCASPGSKTSQMLEMLHAKDTDTDKATGFVVANDADPKRAYMLHHQLKRFTSPNLFITCQDAQFFPLVAPVNEDTGELEPKTNGIFDRILADVPCSGDGTLRKNKNIWDVWDANNGVSLHPMQVMIGVKSAQLLRVGGLMVYSTCTPNPIEDEAVVSQLLRRCEGALEIVDCSNMLPGLKRRPGLSDWKVAVQVSDLSISKQYHNENGKLKTIEEMKKSGLEPFDVTEDGARPWKSLKFFDTYEDFVAFRKLHPLRKGNLSFPKSMKPTMWPEKDEQKRKDMHLERCLRLLPHDQNTGGFFVCLLRKVAPIPDWHGPDTELQSQPKADDVADKEESNNIPDDKEVVATLNEEGTSTSAEKKKKKKQVPASEKVVEYKPLSEELWGQVCSEYGIKDADHGGSFPSRKQLFFRPSTDKGYIMLPEEESKGPRMITLVSKSLADTFMRKDVQERLHVITAGLPIFKRNHRQEGDCNYRLNSAGIEYAKTHIFERVIYLTLEDIASFLSYSLFQPKDKATKQGKVFSPGVPLVKLSEASREAARTGKHGSNILKLIPEDSKKFYDHFKTELALIAWNARRSISPLMHESELNMLKEQLLLVGLIRESVTEDELESHFQQMNERRVIHEKERAEAKGTRKNLPKEEVTAATKPNIENENEEPEKEAAQA